MKHAQLPYLALAALALLVVAPAARASQHACEVIIGEPVLHGDLESPQSAKEREIDGLVAGRQLVADQELRKEARAAMLEIEKLEDRIKKLRLQNGVWETQETTDKRMNIMTFETFIMLDDLISLQTHFGSEMAATERAALRYRSSEAIINAYERKAKKGEIDKASAEQLIANEKKDLELAKEEYLAYSAKTESISYVLEMMMSNGSIVDPTSMLGGRTTTSDIYGREVSREIEQPYAALESISFALPPMAKFEKADAKPDTEAEEIQKRADKVYENFGRFMETQPVRDLVDRTYRIAGPYFVGGRPTYRELQSLRKRLAPDHNATANLIARRKQTLANELKLRWKLRLMGPQLSENIHTWLGNVDSKYRQSLQPLARLAGLEYDGAMRRRHLAKILKIISLENPKTQLNELLDGSAENPYAAKGELIVTFIRFTRSRNDWNNIKHELEESKHSYDKKLVAELDKYEEEAIKRGPLSLIGPVADPMGSVVSAGVGASVVALTGGGATWVAEKAWFAAQSTYSSENVHALLHLLHVVQ